MNRFFWKSVFCLTLAAWFAAPATAQWGSRNCCLISSSPGPFHTASLGDSVPYDLQVDLGKCSADSVEWTWELITPGLSITRPAPGSAYEANVFIRQDAPAQAQWLARVRAFDSATTVTACTGSQVLNIEVDDAVSPLPDLGASFVTLPTSVPSGQAVVVSARADNIGQRPVLNGFSSRFFLNGQVRSTRSCAGGLAVGASCAAGWSSPILGAGTYEFKFCADVFGEVPEEDELNNCQARQVTVFDRPDLVVRSIEVEQPAFVGQDAWIEVVYANEGLAASGTFVLEVIIDGAPNQFIQAVPLNPGQSATTLVAWLPLAPGEFLHGAFVDPNDEIEESNENNNDRTAPATAIEPVVLPDLEIGINDISMSPAAPVAGDFVEFTVTVRNVGNGPTPPCVPILLEAIDGSFSDTVQCAGLDADGGLTVRFDVPVPMADTRTFTVRADPADVLEEHSEENNMRSVTYNVAGPSGPAITCQGTWRLTMTYPFIQAPVASPGSVRDNAAGQPCFVSFGQNVPGNTCWQTTAPGGLKATWHRSAGCPTSVTVIDEDPADGDPSRFEYDVLILP